MIFRPVALANQNPTTGKGQDLKQKYLYVTPLPLPHTKLSQPAGTSSLVASRVGEDTAFPQPSYYSGSFEMERPTLHPALAQKPWSKEAWPAPSTLSPHPQLLQRTATLPLSMEVLFTPRPPLWHPVPLAPRPPSSPGWLLPAFYSFFPAPSRPRVLPPPLWLTLVQPERSGLPPRVARTCRGPPRLTAPHAAILARSPNDMSIFSRISMPVLRSRPVPAPNPFMAAFPPSRKHQPANAE